MKAVIAIDSFKGSLSTYETGNAAKAGILRAFPNAEVVVFPLADGGEGSAEIIIEKNNGARKKVSVLNPIGESIVAEYGIISSQKAVMEMAAASGITLISEKDKNPMNTTTYGVGQMIKDAIENGCRSFVVCIGGSATNDAGTGMLTALGFEFLDENDAAISFGAKDLAKIKTIKTDKVIKELSECEFVVACDVENPLFGQNGCSAVFGPQKGATPEMVVEMDFAMRHFDTVTKTVKPYANGNYPGCGAAGGLGYAFLYYLNATLKSGIGMVLEEIKLENEVETSDIIITGEGRLDGQTAMGKAPIGVAKIAEKYQKPVIAIAGGVTNDAVKCNGCGIDAFFSVTPAPCTLAEAMENSTARNNITNTVEQIFRAVKISI